MYNDIRKLFQQQGHTKSAKSPIFKILEQQCTCFTKIYAVSDLKKKQDFKT